MKTTAEVAADFDEIATALGASPPREHLTPAERALLAYVPETARTAIDVGCGDGFIARTLAARGIRVLGIDVSPRMIALARARAPSELAVEFSQRDVAAGLEIDVTFDVVLSIATVHHLPLAEIVPRLAGMVAPGGVLLIQDVVDRPGIVNFPLNVAATINRRVRESILGAGGSRDVRRSYASHGAGERYLQPSDVAKAFEPLVPGARILHHLEWRYSVIWTRHA